MDKKLHLDEGEIPHVSVPNLKKTSFKKRLNLGGLNISTMRKAHIAGPHCLALFQIIFLSSRLRPEGSGFVSVTEKLAMRVGIDSRPKRTAALNKLEAAGLVEVVRSHHKSSMARPLPQSEHDAGDADLDRDWTDEQRLRMFYQNSPGKTG